MPDYVADYNKDGTIDPEEQKRYWAEIGLDETGRAYDPNNPVNQKGSPVKTPLGTFHIGGGSGESDFERRKREQMFGQAEAAGQFAGVGEAGYGAMTAEMAAQREAMRRRALGQDSLSREQLRQGLQQNLAAQRAYAASASPQNAAMAARTGAMQVGRLGYGMAGQAATAGIQERAAAEAALNQAILAQREQDARVALGSRGNALTGYGGTPNDKSWWDKYGSQVLQGAGTAALAMSDERLKEDIEDGDAKAARALKSLGTYSFKYKDEKHGKGTQLGIMAQALERAGLKHTVVETPAGKAVDGAKAATTSLGLVAALARRVEKLEGK